VERQTVRVDQHASWFLIGEVSASDNTAPIVRDYQLLERLGQPGFTNGAQKTEFYRRLAALAACFVPVWTLSRSRHGGRITERGAGCRLQIRQGHPPVEKTMDSLVAIGPETTVAGRRAVVPFEMTHGCLRDSCEVADKRLEDAGSARDHIDPKYFQDVRDPVVIAHRLNDDVQIVIVEFEMPPRSFEQSRANRPGPRHAFVAQSLQAIDDQSDRIPAGLVPKREQLRLTIATLRMRIERGARIARGPAAVTGRLRLRERSHKLAASRAQSETLCWAAPRTSIAVVIGRKRTVIHPPN